MTDRNRKTTPTYAEAVDPMDGPPTRPDIPEPVRRRRQSSQQLRALICTQCEDLRRTVASLRRERERDAERLAEAKAATMHQRIRAERLQEKLDALREVRR